MKDHVFTQVGSRISISNIIASEIEKAILNKIYPPGSKLPSENELCKQFGVSRTSVREALRILDTQGFVSIEKGKGVFIENYSSENVSNSIKKFIEHRLDGDYAFDLIHVRQIIEPGIAFYAAVNRDDEDIEKMKTDIKDITDNEGNAEVHAKADMSFHLHLAHASKNRVMPLLLKPIHRLMPSIKSNILAAVEEAKESAIEWHTKILDEVIKQDAAGAENMMIEHLKIAEEHIYRALKKNK